MNWKAWMLYLWSIFAWVFIGVMIFFTVVELMFWFDWQIGKAVKMFLN